MANKRGLLFIGLCGHLSTVTMAGAMAIANEICPPTGMISTSEECSHIPFTDFDDIVFGGWDIRSGRDAFSPIKDTGIEDIEQLYLLTDSVKSIQKQSFPGVILNAGEAISGISEQSHVVKTGSLTEAVEKIHYDIVRFREENDLAQIVVINLTSTEPPVKDACLFDTAKGISSIIKKNMTECIRPSFLYAYAAITSGCGYINFTPSEGGFSHGLVELARQYGVPVMGNDGKTGETLVKSALAPMFAMRNLEVLSWEGYNILGNTDGKILQNHENGASKIKSKDRLLPHILGYHPHSKVSIDYVPSLGDRKTAWDFIHFQGFLNTKMSMQFIWQGCDSVLAAPLILDLARFAFLALDREESGVMTHMASFFKSPWGVDEHALGKQFSLLEEYCSAIKS
ncbi:inositol-3-phosphate synthase [Desulfobacter curvatus]|uniref:inositol-3-phosphate synthase n=1 Tax=Desulfobacter curvatus TaxID=2290 RepID=UPI000369FF1A|nr:inositol-3-phosphate synthase [Desulfobacter curvatus]